MKKIIFPAIILLIITIFLGCQENYLETSNLPLYNVEQITKIESKPSPDIETINAVIKSNITNDIPFACQAPNANWGDPYQEACEETSIIMAYEFTKNNEIEDLDKNNIDSEINKMVNWEIGNWGGHYDLDAKKTAELLSSYYNIENFEVRLINNIDEIKSILSQGNIIIAPTYGQKLANPHFTAPGPVYHMLIIKGYDSENFITNDPGIWQGKNFTYSFENLFNSICDLPSEAVMKKGFIKENKYLMDSCQKNIIIIKK